MQGIALDPDLVLVIGLLLAVLCIPSLVAAWSERRFSRGSAITALIAASLMAVAALVSPNGYTPRNVPNVVTEVISRYVL